MLQKSAWTYINEIYELGEADEATVAQVIH